MTNQLDNPAPSAVRPRRRRWPYVLGLLCLPVLAAIGAYCYRTISAAYSLASAIAETDKLDPRWRLQDVEADRAAVPDAENSATPAMAAKALLPKDWPAWDGGPPPQDPQEALKRKALADGFQSLEPQRQLNDEEMVALRAEITRAVGALAEARKLDDLPAGRYPITYSPDFISTLLPHTQDARVIADLLAKDAMLRSQDKDADSALASCRGVLNSGRSVGDEPTLISQLVRVACRGIAVRRAERVLAQGEPSDEALERFQALLAKEEPEPLLLIAARGERGGMDRLMEAIQAGKIRLSPRDLDMTAGFGGQTAPSLAEDLALWAPGARDAQRAAMLRYMNHAVELASAKPPTDDAKWQKLDATAKDQPVLVRLLVPAFGKVARSVQRSQAQLRCAIGATAAERFRRDKGRWPDTFKEELKKAGYVADMPTDPYDGQPLRWRRAGDGVEIYSIGPDGQDDGGNRDGQNPETGAVIGFRLWDPAKRRQPAAPLPPPPGAVQGGPVGG
jgi:hypothetical protein